MKILDNNLISAIKNNEYSIIDVEREYYNIYRSLLGIFYRLDPLELCETMQEMYELFTAEEENVACSFSLGSIPSTITTSVVVTIQKVESVKYGFRWKIKNHMLYNEYTAIINIALLNVLNDLYEELGFDPRDDDYDEYSFDGVQEVLIEKYIALCK